MKELFTKVLTHVKGKKWLYIINLAIIIIILLPLIAFIQIITTKYDINYNYTKIDDPIEIVKRQIYYNAKDKIVEFELDHDKINSLIQDNIQAIEEYIPEKVTIKKVIFNPTNQRVYIQAKYGKINVPISAKLNIIIEDDGIEAYPDQILLGNKKVPKFIVNMLPTDDLKFSLKYAELDIPQIATVKEIIYGTSIVRASIQLEVSEIQKLVMEYRDDLLLKLDEFKDGQSGPIVTFIEKVLSTDFLSQQKVNEYLDELLSTEELINSAIHFALASDKDKYTAKYDKLQKSVTAWAEPLGVIKYHGSIETTVENVLYDTRLKEFLTWFLREDEISDYTDTVEEYYGIYKKADASYNVLATAFENGDLEEIVRIVTEMPEIAELLALVLPEDDVNEYMSTAKDYYGIYKKADASYSVLAAAIEREDLDEIIKIVTENPEIAELLALVLPENDVNEYLATAKDYYGIYKKADTSLNTLTTAFDSKNIDNIIQKVTETSEIAELLAIIFPEDTVNEYLDSIQRYYKIYTDAKEYLENTIAKVDINSIDEVVQDIFSYTDDAEELRDTLLDFIENLDIDSIRTTVSYLEEDMGAIGDLINEIDPEYYQEFKDYINDLEDNKKSLYSSIEDIELQAVTDSVEAIKAVYEDLIDVIDLLKAKKYAEVFDIISNNKIRFSQVQDVINKYSEP